MFSNENWLIILTALNLARSGLLGASPQAICDVPRRGRTFGAGLKDLSEVSEVFDWSTAKPMLLAIKSTAEGSGLIFDQLRKNDAVLDITHPQRAAN